MSLSSLKVLHILDHSLPLHSGYTFRSHSILHAQQKRGWRPVALTSPKHEENWKNSTTDKEEINGVCYYRTGGQTRGNIPVADELRLMVRLTKRLLDVARKERPNLLHAHSPVLNALPALWVGKKLRIPVVYEIRAFWEDAAVDHGTYSPESWKYKAVRSLETWACRRVAQTAVLCRGIRDDLIKRGIAADKITPVFNGINVDDFAPCPPDAEYQRAWQLEGKKVIGFIGSFYRYEGLDLLVEAVARLVTMQQDVVLLLVGGGEMEAALKTQVDRLRLGGRVIMPGRIAHERVPGVYALVDILVYPRYSMRLTELVTPLKPLEAMAMGKALIASDVGGHRELIHNERTGLLFPAGSVLALVEALVQSLSDGNLRRACEARSRDWVQKEHSWDKTTSAYCTIYSDAMRENR